MSVYEVDYYFHDSMLKHLWWEGMRPHDSACVAKVLAMLMRVHELTKPLFCGFSFLGGSFQFFARGPASL
jgi:hypothetical protein